MGAQALLWEFLCAMSQVENDAAIALSLSQEEYQDAMPFGENRNPVAAVRPHGTRVVAMRCGVCTATVNVTVPNGARAGSTVRAACSRCTVENEFVVPGSQSVAGTLFGYGGSAANGRAPLAPSRPHRPPAPFEGMPGPAADDCDSPHVACLIGDVAVEMLVDTGAQSSVISMPLVHNLNLTSQLDRRRQGVAAGVGRARILGQLRAVPVTLGHVEFALDFTVLDVNEQMLMLGIDQMRRFRCVIDMEQQTLVFGGRGGVEVPFLREPRRIDYRSGCGQM